MSFERITVNQGIMMGKPCIINTGITVELILKKLGDGFTYKDLQEAYPNLTADDIYAALQYAAAILSKEEFVYWKKAGASL